jgi:hypothetical protein
MITLQLTLLELKSILKGIQYKNEPLYNKLVTIYYANILPKED